MTEYERLLERCMCKIPQECKEGERFTMPKAEVLIQGAKTIVTNFYEVAGTLRRDPKHMLKFFLKELATSYEESEKKIVFQGRFPGPLMNRKLELYAKSYVLCPNCCKPDTRLLKSDRIEFIKCEACGAKQAVKRIK
jgi:translation initiation factor 2 subunit 2